MSVGAFTIAVMDFEDLVLRRRIVQPTQRCIAANFVVLDEAAPYECSRLRG
jgi:hypothetical protein